MMGRYGENDGAQATKPPPSKLKLWWPLIALVIVVAALIVGERACQQAKPQGWTTYTTADGLADNYLEAIAVAPDGVLWIGTWEDGISRFDGQTWTTYTTRDGLADNHASVLAVTPSGTLWVSHISIDGDLGVSRFDGETWTNYTEDNGLAANHVRSIAVAPDGALWFGTRYSGVSRFDGQAWTTYTEGDGLADRTVDAIAVAPDGALWFGTAGGGVSRFNGEAWTTYTKADGLAGNHVTTIAVAPDGGLWFGTYEDGVSRFDGETWTTYTEDDGLADNRVRAMAVAPNGTLWVSTGELLSGSGVSRFDGETWITYTPTNSGLASRRVDALAVDDQGRVWMATGKSGLSVFDQQVGLSGQSMKAWRRAWGILVLAGIALSCLLLAVWNVRLILYGRKLPAEATQAQGTVQAKGCRLSPTLGYFDVIIGGLLGFALAGVAALVFGGFIAEVLGFFWTGGHSLYINWKAPAAAASLWGALIGGAGVLVGWFVWLELRRRTAAEGRAMPGCLAVPGLVVACLGLVFLADYVVASYIITQGQTRPPMGFFQIASYLSSLMGGACMYVGVLVASRLGKGRS